MGNYNRIILVGNLVRDPEIRYVQSGSPVTKFTIAVNRRTEAGRLRRLHRRRRVG